MPTVEEIISGFDLSPHPEGGYFKETYRSGLTIPKSALHRTHPDARNASTAIYYLLPSGSTSRFHRIASDEIWHFYLGGPLRIFELASETHCQETLLGPKINNGEVLQHVVPAGKWFGARPDTDTYSFVGCTVAPGFDFADFELADADKLASQFPNHRDTILHF